MAYLDLVYTLYYKVIGFVTGGQHRDSYSLGNRTVHSLNETKHSILRNILGATHGVDFDQYVVRSIIL